MVKYFQQCFKYMLQCFAGRRKHTDIIQQSINKGRYLT